MANIYSVRLERDERGRIRTKKEDINGRSVEWRYGYDESGRLSEVAQNGVGVERYTYDSAGRRKGVAHRKTC
ncbi:YD repeat-containing protein [Paucidesulfovibrio gracilis DSM 16080]|uniref:YD repeat-containing protein n=1 Tax=Paucidesulfovibrio gracilis DSM 16080 TaxID=1121449 RepID=A0A1T4XA48_9BACT|nr:YD repeat-containing protein [Paucidesulfovibrio gracilis DSM 16080]